MSIWNEREECLDAEERAQRRLERLQSTINRAYKNVPFHRNRFQARGIDPSQVGSLADLQRIPFIERRHLGDNYPYGLFAVPLRDIVRIHTAPGSTLKPTVTGYTKHDLALWREMAARAMTAAGVTASDILQITLDPGLANWGRDYKDGAEAIEASVIPLTFLPAEKQLMVLADYKTSVLITAPSAAAVIVDTLFRANLNPNALSLKTLILVGEAPDWRIRDQLESQLHVNTWVHYGLSEVPGPALAFECERRAGLHVSDDHFLAEVIDAATGRVVPEGEPGELILTTLTTRGFPLIRFRTGDRVRFIPEPCPCGRTLKRMEWLPERTDEMTVIRGVKVHHSQVLLRLERALGTLPGRHRLLARQEGLEEYLEVRLVVDDRLFSDAVKELEKCVRNVQLDLSQELGVPVRVRLQEPGSFAPAAQISRIEDHRKQPPPG